eukprot:COSAG05_NODE_22380_length_265_cov_0.626506_1_plen_39_part_01
MDRNLQYHDGVQRFTLVRVRWEASALPQAATCFNQLFLH